MLATRNSLIERLGNWDDRARWQEFFDTYWRLIYGVARKSGLSDAEAQDVVQDTIFGVAKNIAKFDSKAGSFKSWLMQLTRWRIIDQVRKRQPGLQAEPLTDSQTGAIERIPDPAAENIESVWDDEWRESLFEAAVERVKKKVNPRHFQIFDCAVIKRWPPSKVAATLNVSVAQVYLVKHRIAGLLKREVIDLEKAGR